MRAQVSTPVQSPRMKHYRFRWLQEITTGYVTGGCTRPDCPAATRDDLKELDIATVGSPTDEPIACFYCKEPLLPV